MLDGRAPAADDQPTGVLAFQVHQCAELVCRGAYTGRKEKDPPSSYVAIFLNDEKVFQTRVKPVGRLLLSLVSFADYCPHSQLSSTPYINAAHEVILRDWRTARVDFAVMDYRDRDHDVLIGMVSLSLAELMSKRSQITK